jgi:hypothetical protein
MSTILLYFYHVLHLLLHVKSSITFQLLFIPVLHFCKSIGKCISQFFNELVKYYVQSS